MPKDRFNGKGYDDPLAVAQRHYAIAPSNSPLPAVPRAFYVETGGTLVLEAATGTVLTYNVVQGQRLELRAVKVLPATTAVVYGWD